jgi:hypothetical protein
MDEQRRRAEKIRRTVEEFQNSGLTRREFCQQHQIPVTTLDYWRRRQPGPARLIEVELPASGQSPGFSVSLPNGRRIESAWKFVEEDLTRLIRVLESA